MNFIRHPGHFSRLGSGSGINLLFWSLGSGLTTPLIRISGSVTPANKEIGGNSVQLPN